MNYCTLFNRSYISNGLVLYNSMIKNSKNHFNLYVLAMDSYTFDYFQNESFPNLTCINLCDFENKDLLDVKGTRTFGEYCWTCTPSLISYCLKKYSLDYCIYLDADLYFFNDPLIVWNEMPVDSSILLTNHNYHPIYDNRFSNGLYCVQYLGFKNDKNGLIALNWWKKSCIEWCYSYLDNNRFGDQKYLDDWLTRFNGIYIVENKGAGLAPWNLELFDLVQENEPILIDKITRQKYKLIFYHFHGFKIFKNKVRLTEYSYIISNNFLNYIYKPYIKEISIYINLQQLKKYNWIEPVHYYFEFIKKKLLEIFNLFVKSSQSPFSKIINR